MSCVFWNCQGLGVPLTIHILGDILRKHHPILVFLSETKATSILVEKLKKKWNLFGVSVDKIGQSGGLALLWSKDNLVDLISLSINHIDVEVQCKDSNIKWRATGFYGIADQTQRHRTWGLLRTLQSQRSLPWVVGGDFNEILCNAEKEGGNMRQLKLIEMFRETLDDCRLSEIGYVGPPFTWTNNQKDPNTIRCRLDRCCANNEWLSLFPQACVHHLELPGSDHIPIMLSTRDTMTRRRRKINRPFRFEAIWIRREECEEIVQNKWAGADGTNPMEDYLRKANKCRLALIQWNKSTLKKPRSRIEEIKKKLSALQEGSQTNESRAAANILRGELEQLYEDENTYWKQRSRIQWMREGDRNTGFFHAKATVRNRTNRVNKLRDDAGNWKETDEEMEYIISEYFNLIFQSTNPREDEIDEVLEHLEARIPNEASRTLSLAFTVDEVTRAISQMAPLKSPGPDGLPVLFYKKYWHILGDTISSCVLNFLNNRKLPAAINFTYIVLIPKVKQPERITQFRPISLCNVIYKIGSKIIANRLKPFLSKLISPTQSAFVPKRLITDNVLVAFEINHFIKSNPSNRVSHMAIKLDISKAYDRIEWLFLKKTLIRLGFPVNFIELIMLCISSVSYSFLMNGSQFGHVHPSRGLRQGDPLSPYLFILCAEALIAMVQRAAGEERLHGIKIAPLAPVVTNLCFADDTLIFCEASREDATILKHILDKYARTSGQEINFEKSTMVFSPSTPSEVKNQIHHILGFQVVDCHEKYLGMPASMGRTRKEIFSFLRDRVWARIKGWGEKQLSRAGKEVLIKAVLQSIPSYIMSCFLIPQGLIRDLESAIKRFWWGDGKARGMAWMSWEKLCKGKTIGGMGFRDLHSFNLALLAKQAWRLVMQPNLLFTRVFKAKYFPQGDIFSAGIGTRPSTTWRSILTAVPYLKSGMRSRIGDGTSTSIWGDRWLTDETSFTVITRRPIHNVFPDKVSDIIDQPTRSWNISLINATFWPIDRNRILAVPIGSTYAKDRMIWHYTKNGYFSVRTCYHLILTMRKRADLVRNRGAESSSGSHTVNWKEIWQLPIPPKVRLFLWRACSDILPNFAELYRRKVIKSPQCPACGHPSETTLHVVKECRGLSKVWEAPPFNIFGGAEVGTMWCWFNYLKHQLSSDLLSLAVIIMWKAWDNRNIEVHGDNLPLTSELSSWSMSFMEAFRNAQIPAAVVVKEQHPSSWLPPPTGILKINVDAAFPKDKDYFSTSLVVRDWNGKCIYWKTRKYLGRPQVTDGEARAILNALDYATTKGWRSIMIEGDNIQVIEAIRKGESTLSPYGALVEDCLQFSSCFSHCSFHFIKRNGNTLAHNIAITYGHECNEGSFIPLILANSA